MGNLGIIVLLYNSIPFTKINTSIKIKYTKIVIITQDHRTNKENFQCQKWDLNKAIESIIMMIMIKNIQKMDVWEIKQMEIYVIKFIYGKNQKI